MNVYDINIERDSIIDKLNGIKNFISLVVTHKTFKRLFSQLIIVEGNNMVCFANELIRDIGIGQVFSNIFYEHNKPLPNKSKIKEAIKNNLRYNLVMGDTTPRRINHELIEKYRKSVNSENVCIGILSEINDSRYNPIWRTTLINNSITRIIYKPQARLLDKLFRALFSLNKIMKNIRDDGDDNICRELHENMIIFFNFVESILPCEDIVIDKETIEKFQKKNKRRKTPQKNILRYFHNCHRDDNDTRKRLLNLLKCVKFSFTMTVNQCHLFNIGDASIKMDVQDIFHMIKRYRFFYIEDGVSVLGVFFGTLINYTHRNTMTVNTLSKLFKNMIEVIKSYGYHDDVSEYRLFNKRTSEFKFIISKIKKTNHKCRSKVSDVELCDSQKMYPKITDLNNFEIMTPMKNMKYPPIEEIYNKLLLWNMKTEDHLDFKKRLDKARKTKKKSIAEKEDISFFCICPDHLNRNEKEEKDYLIRSTSLPKDIIQLDCVCDNIIDNVNDHNFLRKGLNVLEEVDNNYRIRKIKDNRIFENIFDIDVGEGRKKENEYIILNGEMDHNEIFYELDKKKILDNIGKIANSNRIV